MGALASDAQACIDHALQYSSELSISSARKPDKLCWKLIPVRPKPRAVHCTEGPWTCDMPAQERAAMTQQETAEFVSELRQALNALEVGHISCDERTALSHAAGYKSLN